MASRRMIASDIYEDDFYLGMDLFGRNLWIGLIVRCADDQGRMQDNATLIKSQVFPADDFTAAQVEAALAHYANCGKIARYTAGGKQLIQIVNWWKHQTPQWANKSRYPAPAGWNDREKYHATGSKIIVTNWDKPGGFDTNQVSNLVTNPHANLVSNPPDNPPTKRLNDVKGDVKGDGDGKAEAEGEGKVADEKTTAAAAAAWQPEPRPNIFGIYEQEIGLLTPMIADVLKEIERDYPEDWFKAACREAVMHNARNVKYIKSILARWKVEGFGSSSKPQPASRAPAQEDDAIARIIASGR